MLPLLICAGPRALPTAAIASTYYAAADITSIVVRPAVCSPSDGWFAPGTRFIDDEALVGFSEVKSFLEEKRDILARFNRSPGWFLQQFIKLSAVTGLDEEFVFLADGDTIFSHDILIKILCSPTILTTNESYANYDRLLMAIGMQPPRHSCVANGNVFGRHPFLSELASPRGFCSILKEHVLPSQGTLDFSEYQITGSLLEPSLGSRPIRMFRRFDLMIPSIDTISAGAVANALRRYDAIAIEAEHHRSFPKRVAARFFYSLGRSW